MAGIDAVTVMSVQSKADADFLNEALHWALPRLGGYVLAALGSVVAFTIWAVVYTYVWPGKPTAISIEAPAPTTTIAPTPIVDDPPASEPGTGALAGPAISQLPADALSVTQVRKLSVYDLNNNRIGGIDDVLFSPDGKIYAYVVGVDRFLGGQGRDIAVPAHAVQFRNTDNSGARAILNMSKDAVRDAPIFEFEPGKMRWELRPNLPASAR